MLGEKNVLNFVLRNFANVNARDRHWIEDIREFLFDVPERAALFKVELSDAINNNSLPKSKYEELTDEDFDSQEDLVAWLTRFDALLFPKKPSDPTGEN